MKRCRDTNQLLAIIYFDIDNFKNINDQYGHIVGDKVLKEVSSLVKNYLSPADFFGRWGGEEFIIITRDKSLNETAQFAEKLRSTIQNPPFHVAGQVTTSFGVASLEQNDLPQTFFKRQDMALYRAKNEGRNIVKVY